MKKRWISLCMCILMLASLLTGCGMNTRKIKFGAAGLGGTYRVFGDTFANLVTSKNKKYSMEVKTTAGSAANLRLLSDGYIQMAIAQMDLTNDAYERTGIFENEKKHGGYSAVAALYTEACQVVVRADSGINTIEDLQDKRVSVGEEESGTEQNAKQILAVYGLNDSLVDEVNLDYTNAAQELKAGTIDAFFCTAGAQTTAIGELAKKCDIRLLNIDEKSADKLKRIYKFYTDCTIPKETYQGQMEDIQTVGVKAVLLASDKLSADTVKDITKILFKNKEELQYSLPVDISIDEKTAVEGVTIPFHEGAAAYYEECGINIAD